MRLTSTNLLNIALLANTILAAPSSHKHHARGLEKRAIKMVTISETITVLDGVTLWPSTEATTTTTSSSSSSAASTSLAAVEKAATTTSSSSSSSSSSTTSTSKTSTPTTTTTSSSSSTKAPVAATTTSSTSSKTSSKTTSKAKTTSTSATTPSTTSSTKATSTTSSSSSTTSLSTFAQEVLDRHNKYRALHDASDLEWDDTLASYASDYMNSNDFCSTHVLVHSSGDYGENLAIGYSFTGTVDAWYDEIDDYDFSDPGYSSSTGHFTQVVWKDSTKLGCAYQYCDESWSNFVICEYDPAGNIDGEYAENVIE